MTEGIKLLGKLDSSATHQRNLRELCNYICNRFDNDLVFFVDRNHNFETTLEQYHPKITVRKINSINYMQNQCFQNIALMEILENHEDAAMKKILNKSWQLLSKKGCLIVIVPNEDVYKHEHQIRKFSHDEIIKLLKRFGRPKLLKEQPFKWLALYVRKEPENLKRKHSIEKRFNVTAELCKGKVVEFGCGRGFLTKQIHDLGLEIIGIDKNPQKIKQAKRICEEIKFICADVLELKLEYDSFDTVILPEILEHISEETGNKMLQTAWNILKPNGRLIVSVPNENCIPSRNHVRVFNRASLTGILSRFGTPVLVTEQPYKWLIMCVDKRM